MNGDAWHAEDAEQYVAPLVILKLNGEVIGQVPGDARLGETVMKYAQEKGLRSFIVLGDGTKVNPGSPEQTVGDVATSTLELFAKDARGH